MNPEVLVTQSNIFVTFLASFLIWIMFFGLWIVWVIDGKFRREQVLHAIMSTVLVWVIAQMIKNLFPTLRPFEMNGNPPLTLTVPGDGAFPSAHTAAAFALATTMWLHRKREGIFFVVAAFLVGAARVWSNVHFPPDIIGGTILGILVALAIDRVHLYNLLTNRKKKKET